MASPRTLYDKIWDAHLVHEAPGESAMLYIDRHLVHEVTSPQAFEGLRDTHRKARRPDLTLAVADHNVPTKDRALGITDPESREQIAQLETNAREFGIEYLKMDDIRQGIVHIVGPEQGWTLPGTTIVCGDSHTSTHGAFGSLAFGIGTSEVEHVLATQTLLTQHSKNMRVNVNGTLPVGVTAKDIALAIIARIGTAGGTGYVIEYAGDAVRALSMEGRMTLCNMTIEAGARAGLIAPDETTFKYVSRQAACAQGRCFRTRADVLEDSQVRRRRKVRRRDRSQCRRHRADGHLGHVAGTGPAGDGECARSGRDRGRQSACRGRARARLYGSDAGRSAQERQDRPRLHRLLHQRPDRGSACRRANPARQEDRSAMSARWSCRARAW